MAISCPESMGRFFELLKESAILHGLIPELGALTALNNKLQKVQNKKKVFLNTQFVAKTLSRRNFAP